MNGVKEIAETNQNSLSGTKDLARPSSALKMGQLRKKLASLKRGQAIRNRNTISKEKTAEFLELYSTEWNEKIARLAHQNMKELKFSKETILPLTGDLQKLTVSFIFKVVYLFYVLK